MGGKARRQIKHIREDEKRKNKNLLGLISSLWGYDHVAVPREGGRNGGLHACGRRWLGMSGEARMFCGCDRGSVLGRGCG